MNIEVSSTKNVPKTSVVTVGTTVVSAPVFTNLIRGINIKAPSANTVDVLVGSVGLSDPASWFPLSPGESLFLAVDNTDKIGFRSSANAQVLNLIGL
jgi:hypothetical protein